MILTMARSAYILFLFAFIMLTGCHHGHHSPGHSHARRLHSPLPSPIPPQEGRESPLRPLPLSPTAGLTDSIANPQSRPPDPPRKDPVKDLLLSIVDGVGTVPEAKEYNKKLLSQILDNEPDFPDDGQPEHDAEALTPEQLLDIPRYRYRLMRAMHLVREQWERERWQLESEEIEAWRAEIREEQLKNKKKKEGGEAGSSGKAGAVAKAYPGVCSFPSRPSAKSASFLVRAGQAVLREWRRV